LALEPLLQPFCSGYFGDRLSLFAQADLDCDPLILGFLLSLRWQAFNTIPSFFSLEIISQTFVQAGLEW
jgi:hypothetical protein